MAPAHERVIASRRPRSPKTSVPAAEKAADAKEDAQPECHFIGTIKKQDDMPEPECHFIGTIPHGSRRPTSPAAPGPQCRFAGAPPPERYSVATPRPQRPETYSLSTPRQEYLTPLAFQPTLPELLAAASTPQAPALDARWPVFLPGPQAMPRAQHMMHPMQPLDAQFGLPVCVSDPFGPLPLPLPFPGAHPSHGPTPSYRPHVFEAQDARSGVPVCQQGAGCSPASPARSTFFELASDPLAATATFVAAAEEDEEEQRSGADTSQKDEGEDEDDVEEQSYDRHPRRWCGGWCGGEDNVSPDAEYIN